LQAFRAGRRHASVSSALPFTQEIAGSNPARATSYLLSWESPRADATSVFGLDQRPRMRDSASSTASGSLASSRPADCPRRCGSTTVACFASTRVSSPSTLMTGRNVAGDAPRDVGATMVVLGSRNPSACATSAQRQRTRRWINPIAGRTGEGVLGLSFLLSLWRPLVSRGRQSGHIAVRRLAGRNV
jgi:hypothetical protein